MSNVPKLRFKEFSGEWEEKKLKNFSLIYDGTHQTPKYTETGIPFVSVENINDIKNTEKYISKEDFDKYKVKPKKNDILMTRITAGIIGATTVIMDNEPLAYYVSLALIRLKENVNIDVQYLHYYINSIYFKKELNKRIIHTAFPKKINLGDIGECHSFLPSKQEQEKIASFLTSVDTKIEQLTKKEKLLQQYKKGVMQRIFNQKIKFKADDGSKFCNWEEKKLSSLCHIKKGSQLNKETLTDKGNYPALNGGVNPSGYTTDWNTESDTITISEGGNSCGYVNFVQTRFWSGGHNYSLQDLKDNIDVRYLFQYLKFNEEAIMRLRVGSGLPNIQKGEISNFKVLVPCPIEQTKIATFLSSIDSKIEQVQKQLNSTKEFKKVLLQHIFV